MYISLPPSPSLSVFMSMFELKNQRWIVQQRNIYIQNYRTAIAASFTYFVLSVHWHNVMEEEEKDECEANPKMAKKRELSNRLMYARILKVKFNERNKAK